MSAKMSSTMDRLFPKDVKEITRLLEAKGKVQIYLTKIKIRHIL